MNLFPTFEGVTLLVKYEAVTWKELFWVIVTATTKMTFIYVFYRQSFLGISQHPIFPVSVLVLSAIVRQEAEKTQQAEHVNEQNAQNLAQQDKLAQQRQQRKQKIAGKASQIRKPDG